MSVQRPRGRSGPGGRLCRRCRPFWRTRAEGRRRAAEWTAYSDRAAANACASKVSRALKPAPPSPAPTLRAPIGLEQRAEGPRGALLTVLLTERDCCTLASVKTNTVGIRLEPALLDRLDVVAARWSATSPIPITYDRSTIVRGLMQRALILVEAELGITPAVATVPANRPAVTRSAKPAKSAKSVKSAKRGR